MIKISSTSSKISLNYQVEKISPNLSQFLTGCRRTLDDFKFKTKFSTQKIEIDNIIAIHKYDKSTFFLEGLCPYNWKSIDGRALEKHFTRTKWKCVSYPSINEAIIDLDIFFLQKRKIDFVLKSALADKIPVKFTILDLR